MPAKGKSAAKKAGAAKKQVTRRPTASRVEREAADPVSTSLTDKIKEKVAQRLRETFSCLTDEEKDVTISAEGLTLRQTLTRDLQLAEAGSDKCPSFGLFYNNQLKKMYRKKGSTHDMIKPNAGETGVCCAELMEVTWGTKIEEAKLPPPPPPLPKQFVTAPRL